MFFLNRQEKQAVLFVCFLALAGSAVNFLLKLIPSFEHTLIADIDKYKMDINQASLADLLSLRLVPVGLAQRIIAYRQDNGHFRSLEELKQVRGIGPVRYEKLRDLLCVR